MHDFEAQFICQWTARLNRNFNPNSLSTLVRVLILGVLAAFPGPLFASSAAAVSVLSPKLTPPMAANTVAPRIPLRFEPCLPVTCGASTEWSYIGLGGRYRILIAANKIAFVRSGDKGKNPQTTVLEIVGAARDARLVTGARLTSEASYFTGNDPKQWHSHVLDYDSITLQGVYAGIDLRFYENAQQLEFDVQAQPGADLNQVRFRVQDDAVAVQANGDLLLDKNSAKLTIHIPAAYQVDAVGHQLPVDVRFLQLGKDEVVLKTGALNKALTTVIDPTVEFSTYLAQSSGNSNSVEFGAVAVDASGNIWVAGSIYGPLPDLSSNPALNCTSCTDYNGVAFAAKFGSSGNLLVVVELGGTTDLNVAMALDTSGNVYLAGNSYGHGLENPVTQGAYQTNCNAYPGSCVFVAKIDPTGSNLIYGTFLGGTTGNTSIVTERGGIVAAGAIQVDSSGDLWIGGGVSPSTNFPVTANAFQSTCLPGGGILAEISPDGSGLLYGTYVCGTDATGSISQIALASGKVLVTGSTQSLNFPVSPTAIHRTNQECAGTNAYASYDSNFLASIDPTQAGSSGLAFSTFICEYVQSIAVGRNNNIYLGVSASPATNNTAATSGTFALIYNSGVGASGPGVEVINSSGSQVVSMAWLGLQDAELTSLALDAQNNVYVGGELWVDTTGIPIVDSVQSSLGTASQCNITTWQSGQGACSGIWITKFDPLLDAPIFSTVYGPVGGSTLGVPQGSSGSQVTSGPIAVDSNGNLYAVGFTGASNFPTTSGAFQPDYVSGVDGFLLKITGVAASSDVLLTTDHLFFSVPLCTYDPCSIPNNYNSNTSQTVTIVNDATSPLQIASIVADNSGTNPLSGSQNCVGTVAAGSSCAITVTFSPQQPGNLTGTITVTDSSSSSPHIIAGIGTGVMGIGVPASTSLTFASTAVGQSSSAQTLQFNNTGNSALNVSNITAAGDFSETNNCSGGINLGTGCAIEVTFTPTQGGSRTGTLSISDDGPGSPHMITLTGSATGPGFSISPTSLIFASQTDGTTSAALTLTISNTGTTALSITSIAASGDFAQTNTCATSVAAGANCAIVITFTPTAAGTRTGTLTITDNATGSPQAVALNGTGVAATPTATLSPTSLTFASQTTGTTSTAQAVKLTNSGQAALTLSSIAASGDFAETNNCGTSVAAGANCTISVTFTPSVVGTRTGALMISDNASGSPQTASLSGTGAGVTAPAVVLSPTSLTFASLTDGTTSAAQAVTLTNSGTAALSITSVTASGDFAETNTCGSSVAAGANCTISVTFTPTAAGTPTGTLTITDNAGSSPQTVTLSGGGQAVSLSSSSTGLTISSAGGSATATIQLSSIDGFTGTVNLACTVTYQGQGTPNSPPTCSLSPSQEQVAGNSPVSSSLTVSTTAASASAGPQRLLDNYRLALTALLFLGVLPRRRWRRGLLFTVLSLVALGGTFGCSGSSAGGASSTSPSTSGTTTGNYKVAVAATSGTVTTSTTIPLLLQ